jgi:hypothetical protein
VVSLYAFFSLLVSFQDFNAHLSIHTNENMKDGYLDYGANHVDFHDDGCKTDSYAGPSGDGTFQDCTIAC